MKKAWSFLLVENMCTTESKHSLSVSYDYDQNRPESIDELKQPWETLSSLMDLTSWKKISFNNIAAMKISAKLVLECYSANSSLADTNLGTVRFYQKC